MALKVTKGGLFPQGPSICREGIRLVFRAEPDEQVSVIFSDGRESTEEIEIPVEYGYGRLRSVVVSGLPESMDRYAIIRSTDKLSSGGRKTKARGNTSDFYARQLYGYEEYGRKKDSRKLFCRLYTSSFDWQEDRNPGTPYSDSLIYGVNVRSFTMDPGSGVRHKGTFKGVTEKLKYIKKLGVTALELMPCYEFDEIIAPNPVTDNSSTVKVNLFGFTGGYYFAPKSAYSSSEDAVDEYKNLVRTFHRAGIEIIMQFYFTDDVSSSEILDILRFWVEEYHVDGFHVFGSHILPELLAEDSVLSGAKLILDNIDRDRIFGSTCPAHKKLALYRDDFLYDMRRFLKGDENCCQQVLGRTTQNDECFHYINHMAAYNSMSLYDMVSYDRKNNEANGEQGLDGAAYDASWNCGEEGPTLKRSVNSLRIRQLQNAVLLQMLSQGTPYIQAGDELLNTRGGNNNPYCQDNETGWVQWKLNRTNRAFLNFITSVIEFRKSHGVFHNELPLRWNDYISCGYPDISIHGTEAWKPDLAYYNRHFGLMYISAYDSHAIPKEYAVYVAYNMYWGVANFALPKLPKNVSWYRYSLKDGSRLPEKEPFTIVKTRSIDIFIAVKEDSRTERGSEEASS